MAVEKLSNLLCLCVCVCVICPVVSDSLLSHRLQPARLLCSWDSPGKNKNTTVGCHSLLQGIFQAQGSNSGLLHCRQILYYLSHQGNPTWPRWQELMAEPDSNPSLLDLKVLWEQEPLGLILPKQPLSAFPQHGQWRGLAQIISVALDQSVWASHVALVVKNPFATAEGADSVPGLGRFPGVGYGNPLQCSDLKNSMDRGAWWATIHGLAKSQTQLSY